MLIVMVLYVACITNYNGLVRNDESFYMNKAYAFAFFGEICDKFFFASHFT